MDDPRIAALAEALTVTQGYTPEIHRELYGDTVDFLDVPHEWFTSARGLAAAILAALPPGWCGHEPSCCEYACYEDPGCSCDGCEIARLRRIEEAAWEVSENAEMHFHERPSTPMWWLDSRRMAALRAALEEKPG